MAFNSILTLLLKTIDNNRVLWQGLAGIGTDIDFVLDVVMQPEVLCD